MRGSYCKRVEHLDPGLTQTEARLAPLAGQRKSAPTHIAPVAHGAVHLQDVGQPVAKEVGEFEIRVRQGAGGEICALHRKELPSFWRKPRVAECQRREFFRLVTVVTDDLDLVEERDTIAWQLLWREFSGVDALIEVDQVIGPRQEICTRMCEDFNVSTPPRGPHFKASAVFREGIRPLFVAQLD